MGLFDFFRSKPQKEIEEVPEEVGDLGMPDVDAESLNKLLDTKTESADEEEIIAAHLYDVGEVNTEDLLSNEQDENHSELNVVEEIKLDNSDAHLLNASIIGDLPEQIE